MKNVLPLAAIEAHPMFLWGTLALKTMQMSTAAAQVIAIRTSRMAAAGLSPSVEDRREMTLMGAEKVDAFSRAGAALATGVTPVLATLAGQAFRSGMDVYDASARLAASRTLVQTIARQCQLAGAIVRQVPTGQRSSAAAARLAHRALAPVHATATDNAKRLAKPRRAAGRP